MTLEVFSRDYIPVIQSVFTLIGLISLLLVWWQIRENRLWKRLESSYNTFDSDLNAHLEKELIINVRRLGFEIHEGLDEQKALTIYEDHEARISASAFLNRSENLCAAYRIGYLDKDYAYAVHSAHLIRVHRLLKPLIITFRQKHHDDEIFIELEKVALEWETKQKNIEAKQRQTIAKLSEKLDATKGIKKKV